MVVASPALAGKPGSSRALNPLDLYDVRGLLTEDEQLVQDSVARFIDDRVLPSIQKHFEEHTFPRELIPGLAELGLLGSSLEGYGCAGMNSVSYGLICQELERGDSGIRSFVSVQSSLCMYPIHAFGSEEQRRKYLPGLARGEWVPAPENLIFAGPIGTGKTHLAIALGVEATKQKRRVLFTRAADLVRQLLEARDARELTRLQQRLRRVEVLIIDELGFVPFERAGGELLFNLITDRYERRATVVTTNLAFAEWVTVFAGDEKLTTALLDRLAHHATVITTKGKSYRMRKRRPGGS